MNLLDLLYPPRCVFCRALVPGGGAWICPDCAAALPWAGEQDPFCLAPLYYRDGVRDSLLRYKFHGASHYARTYGAILGPFLRGELAEEADVITWVPLSRKRLRERGYDQARLLADAAARELGRRPEAILKKVRNTQRQSKTQHAELRRANIAGAYTVPRPERVRGRRVLLIDDIVTTGATREECVRTLRAAGAASVRCAALARTPLEIAEISGSEE